MQLGFNGATTMTSDLPTDIRIAGEAGFDVIEITAAKLDKYLETGTLDQVRAQIEKAGLKTWAFNSIERINLRDTAGRAEVLARTKQLARHAQALACPWIVVVPGPADGATWAAIRKDTVAALTAMSDVAAPTGVNLAFEFLGFPWCSVQRADQAWEIVGETGRANVGMVIDTCHFYAGNSTLESIRPIDPRALAIFHINDVEEMPKAEITDANRLFPGDGVIPLADIVAAVRATGFDGVASVEIFRPEYWEREPLAVAKEAHAKAKRVLGI